MFSYRLRTTLSNSTKSFFNQSIKQHQEKFNTPISTGIFQYDNQQSFDFKLNSQSTKRDTEIDFSTLNILPLASGNPFASSFNSSNRSFASSNVNRSFIGNLSSNVSNTFNISTSLSQPALNVFSQGGRKYSTLVDPKRNELPEEVEQLIKNQPKKGALKWEDTGSMKEIDGNGANYDKRQFTYFVVSAGRFIGATALRLAVLRVLFSWGASAETLALATLEVDISKVERGKTITVIWQGKPVFVKHRTFDEIEEAKNVPISELRDPETDEQRFANNNWTVVLAICTHLGCVPVTDAGSYNAFFCPCHGSHYDVSGRIRKGPAPLNLEIPKHSLSADETNLVIG